MADAQPQAEPEAVEPEPDTMDENDNEPVPDSSAVPAGKDRQISKIAARKKAMPIIDAADIMQETSGAAAAALVPEGGETAVTTDQSGYLYVQHPVTKRVTRKQATEFAQKEQLDDRKQKELLKRANTGTPIMEKIDSLLATIFTFLKGILAGMATLLLVSLFYCDSKASLISHYSPNVGKFHQTLLVLTSICVLGALEHMSRVERKNTGSKYRYMFATSFYLVAFILSLLNAPMEDRLNVVHSRNPTWFDQAEILPSFESDLGLWQVLYMIRLVAVILGWLVVASDDTVQPYAAVVNYKTEYYRHKIPA